MFFSDCLQILTSIGKGMFSMVQPFLDFLSNTVTIGGLTYSYFGLFVGVGLVAVLSWGVVKWVLALD